MPSQSSLGNPKKGKRLQKQTGSSKDISANTELMESYFKDTKESEKKSEYLNILEALNKLNDRLSSIENRLDSIEGKIGNLKERMEKVEKFNENQIRINKGISQSVASSEFLADSSINYQLKKNFILLNLPLGENEEVDSETAIDIGRRFLRKMLENSDYENSNIEITGNFVKRNSMLVTVESTNMKNYIFRKFYTELKKDELFKNTVMFDDLCLRSRRRRKLIKQNWLKIEQRYKNPKLRGDIVELSDKKLFFSIQQSDFFEINDLLN